MPGIDESKRRMLTQVLGDFPVPPALSITILESEQLEGGIRHKVEFTVEELNPLFATPVDRIRAFLLVPEHDTNERLPAIVAIHQDGPNSHLGKKEPAGLDGAEDQHFGLELFQRRYVVICPDRIGHAERRRISEDDAAGTDDDRDNRLESHLTGQLVLMGRTHMGKEVYDLMRATDVLSSLDYVDPDRIGAIGHSAGGYALVFFMFMDTRIKCGASSCGFFELLNGYREDAPRPGSALSALPGLAKVGCTADYAAGVAPRPLLLTRGFWEWGRDGKWGVFSEKHVEETRQIEAHARETYRELDANDNLRVIYFDESGGNHAFPPGIKEQVYQWLDEHI